MDDATTEAVALVPAGAFGGMAGTRVLDRLALTRRLPRVLRTDNGLEFCGRAMLTWAQENGVALRLIAPGEPTQNAYSESFKGRFPRRMPERTLVHQSPMRKWSSKPGGVNTTRSDRRKASAG